LGAEPDRLKSVSCFRSFASWPVGFVALASKNSEAVRIPETWIAEDPEYKLFTVDLTGSEIGQTWRLLRPPATAPRSALAAQVVTLPPLLRLRRDKRMKAWQTGYKVRGERGNLAKNL